MSRRPRQRRARGASRIGARYEAVVGPIAHGGHCVVRLPAPEARVVFVRHAIPGERVVLEITEGTDGDRFWRGDAVEVLEPSPDRVPAPCRYAGPGLCGGCDFQHVDLDRQRALKADVVREQLSRLARIDREVVVEAVLGDDPALARGLHWRTRQRYVELPDGGRAMRKHRSHDLVPVETCLIEAPRSQSGEPSQHVALGRTFEVADGGFWQVHPGAPDVLVTTVLEMLRPAPGERCLDLYAGVGLFARFLLDAVGDTGRVVAVEGDRTASALSAVNCPGAEVRAGDVAEVLASPSPDSSPPDSSVDGPFDLVVLDPPREGARRPVVEAVVARTPRAVAYVACDPAALARDVATFAELGYELRDLRAFDLFPMTHHVECVALLEPAR